MENDKMSYEDMEQGFNEAVDKKFNPTYGLDDKYANDILSRPTSEELNSYNAARNDVNGDYMAARDDAYTKRVDSLLASVSDRKDNVDTYTPQEESSVKKVTDIPVNEVIGRQPTKITTKEIEFAKSIDLKKVAKYVVATVIAGAIAYGAVKGGISVIKNPDPIVPEQTPQTIELQENIDNAENFDEVIDIINEHKAQNIESGIQTNPEHVIDTPSSEQTVEEARENYEQQQEQMKELREKTVENLEKKDSMSDSMKEFVEESNRQKVIKIESGITSNPEHVIGDINEIEQGGRSI